MKSIFAKMLLTTACLILYSQSAVALQTYILDPSHTAVTWHINHFGFSNPSGKWMASGTLVLDEKNPVHSSLNVTIPIASLITAVPKLDEHLKSKDFFDALTYPTATYVSNQIIVTGDKTASVIGTLTLHGVSKPVTLYVKLNRLAISEITHKMTAGFTATGELNRSDFGITAYLQGLSNKVMLDIEAEAVSG